METFFDYSTFWLIFPIGIIIATTAMATGIDGAIFWAPVLIFGFKIPPVIAISCGIFIEVFGFGSGVYSYYLRNKILFKQVIGFLFIATIFGLFGAYASKIIPKIYLYGLLSISSLYLAYKNFKRTKREITPECEKHISEIEFPIIKYKNLGRLLSAIGGFLTGAIGVGLGEVNNYYFVDKNKLSIPYASGNSVFLIAFTAFFCSIFNVFWFSHGGSGEIDPIKIYSIVMFAVPSVIIGARIGSIVAHKANPKIFYYFVGVLFLGISALYTWRIFLGK